MDIKILQQVMDITHSGNWASYPIQAHRPRWGCGLPLGGWRTGIQILNTPFRTLTGLPPSSLTQGVSTHPLWPSPHLCPPAEQDFCTIPQNWLLIQTWDPHSCSIPRLTRTDTTEKKWRLISRRSSQTPIWFFVSGLIESVSCFPQHLPLALVLIHHYFSPPPTS